MKFSIGALVVEKEGLRAHTNYTIHKVVGVLDGALLITMYGDGFGGEIHPFDDEMNELLGEPGSRSWREGIRRFQEEALVTPEEALEELRRLEAVKSQLEQDFEGVRSQVEKKMSAAAVLVKEAAALVGPTGKDFYNLTDECKEIYLALNEGGWSHSTMRCRFGR